MNSFLGGVMKVNKFMQDIAGLALTIIMLLTTVDVVLRLFGKPIPGAVEIIAMCGGVAIGFSVPITSWMKGHISVEFLTNALPRSAKIAVDIITRCVAMGLCLLIALNSMKIGTRLLTGREVSGTLELPLYPVAYGLGVCFLVLSIVLFCDILRMFGGNNE